MPTWNLLVDWNNDGDFSDTGEDVTARVRGEVTCERGKDQARIVSPPAAGRLTAKLDNQSKDYSVEHESSPINTNLRPGRKAQVKGSGSALWTGLVDDIGQNPAKGELSATIPCLGTLSRLPGRKVSTALHQSIRTDQAIGYVLDEVGWPVGDRVLSTGDTTFEWFWADDEDAWDLILSILDSEGPGAALYEDENGKIVFENRNYRINTSRSTTSQFTFTDSAHITELAYNPDFKDISNECTIAVDTREAQPDQVIWELDEQIVFAANETKTFIIKTSDPFKAAQVPSPAPSNASQTLTPSTTLTSGSFYLKFRGQTTASSVAYNASAATIQTALEGLSTIGSGNVVCSGGPINTSAVLVTFLGSLGGQAIEDLIEVVSASLNPQSVTGEIVASPVQDGNGTFIEIQSIGPAQPLTSGTFTITTPNGTTGTIQYNDSAATIQTRLRTDVFGIPNTLCTGGPINTSSVLLRFPDITIDWALVTINPTSLTSSVGTATINVTQSAQGGVPDYVIINSGTIASKSLDRTSGTSAVLTITAGATGPTLSSLRVRGCPVTVVRTEQVRNDNDTAASQSRYGVRPVSHRILATISRATAQVLANALAVFYQEPRPSVVFRVANKNATIEAQQLARQISDRVTVQESQTGIDDAYWVERIAHRLIMPNIIFTEFGCERAGGVLTNLISHWDLNEASGTRSDSHGSNHLADTNTVTSAAGKLGNAAVFASANSERLTIADNASLSIGAGVSFAFAGWVKLTTKSATMSIVGKSTGSAATAEYELSYNQAADRFRFSISDGATLSSVDADALGSPSTGTWYFIVCGYNASTQKSFIQVNNGTTNSLAGTHAGAQNGTNGFALGAQNSSGTNHLNGQLDSWSFWKQRVPGAAEAAGLFNAGGAFDYPFF